MSALQKLQEKIEEWKKDHETLKAQNVDLKNQLAGVAEMQKENETLVSSLEEKTKECESLEETAALLQLELEEKDTEIGKIISQVESLLS